MEEEDDQIIWYKSRGDSDYQTSQVEIYKLKTGSRPNSTKLQKSTSTSQTNSNGYSENPLDRINASGSNKRSKIKSLSIEILNQYPTLRKAPEPEIPLSIHVLENQARKKLKYPIERGITNDRLVAVEIEDFGVQIIKEHILSPEYLQALTEEYKTNKDSNFQQPYCFYTDGSHRKARDQTIKMGAAWLQEKGPNPGSSFQAGVDNWPSALRAELVAIILTLLVLPQRSQVEIRTDSATCINTLQKLQNPHIRDTGKRNRKRKNWQL
jgi:hypothetical protein